MACLQHVFDILMTFQTKTIVIAKLDSLDFLNILGGWFKTNFIWSHESCLDRFIWMQWKNQLMLNTMKEIFLQEIHFIILIREILTTVDLKRILIVGENVIFFCICVQYQIPRNYGWLRFIPNEKIFGHPNFGVTSKSEAIVHLAINYMLWKFLSCRGQLMAI